MNYTFLRQGDNLPTVGVLQKLLNHRGAKLKVDGNFGLATTAAVRDLQKNARLIVDGLVGINTWQNLAANANLPIVDSVDVFGPLLQEDTANVIAAAGGSPITLGGMCNGVEQAVSDITRRARNTFLLRFHGHGAPGVAGFSFGRGSQPGISGWGERADLDSDNIEELRPILRRLRPVFGPYGSVEFTHCETGRGATGRSFLSTIARELGVPVSAGINDQYGYGIAAFRFEGPTYTACPGGGSLKSWCQALPDFPPMCF